VSCTLKKKDIIVVENDCSAEYEKNLIESKYNNNIKLIIC